MNVTAKQFFSKGFSFCCFIPLAALTVLQIASGNYWSAAWQAVTLAILCVNNYLICSNRNLRDKYVQMLDDFYEEVEINIALIEYIRALLPPEAKATEKSNNNPTQKGKSFTK